MFICVVIWSSKKICVVIYPTLNCFFFMNVNYHTPILWNDWTPKSHQMEKEKRKNKNYWASGNKLMTIIWFILFIQSQKNSFFFLFQFMGLLLMIICYHQIKVSIDFWCRRRLNPKFLIKTNWSICRKIFWPETVFFFLGSESSTQIEVCLLFSLHNINPSPCLDSFGPSDLSPNRF